MSDVDRLRAELELAEAVEKLEDARAKVLSHKTEKTLATYKAASEKVANLRQAFRSDHPTVGAEGDGVARPDPVRISGKAVQP